MIDLADYYKTCPNCSTHDCNYDCDESKAEYIDPQDEADRPKETEQQVAARLERNHVFAVLEGMTVAHARMGLDYNDYDEAIRKFADFLDEIFPYDEKTS